MFARGFCLLALFSPLWPPTCLGGQDGPREIHVSPNGSPSNSGTPGSPWPLERANAAVRPGDTVVLADGIYAGPIRPARSGQAGKAITYRAARDQGAEFNNLESAVVLTDRSYISVEGIASSNVHRWVVSEGGAHHITIARCRFAKARGWESCRFRLGGDAIHFVGNSLKDGTDLLSVEGGQGHLIEHNTFDTASHTCLVLLGVERSAVRHNVLVNPRMKLMEVFGRRREPDKGSPSRHVFIEHNDFRYSGSFRSEGSASVAMTLTGRSVVVRRNLIRDCQAGVYWIQQGPQSESAWSLGNRFYHNVIYNCGHGDAFRFNGLALIFEGQDNDRNGHNAVVNNIVYFNHFAPGRNFTNFPATTQIGFFQADQARRVELFHNNILCVRGDEPVFAFRKPRQALTLRGYEQAHAAHAGGNLGLPPGFVDAAKGDFRLREGSGCIDAGRCLTVARSPGRGRVLPVADASYFCDGLGLMGGDSIRVGRHRATVVKADYERDELTVDHELAWREGEGVSQNYEGKAPDMGALEFGAEAPPARP